MKAKLLKGMTNYQRRSVSGQHAGLQTFNALRCEINAGLNVVENWNSTNNFIFYGEHGEFTSNLPEDQELSILSLHLLQISPVYINTLLIQNVLAAPIWQQRMTEEDWRGLTPLIYDHVNPYGRIELNMEQRLALAA